MQLSVTDPGARPEGVPLLVGRSVAAALALLIWGGHHVEIQQKPTIHPRFLV